jgi:hypothetical protein
LQQSSELELETIRLGRPAAGVVVATLDRPERMNAMTVVMLAIAEGTTKAEPDLTQVVSVDSTEPVRPPSIHRRPAAWVALNDPFITVDVIASKARGPAPEMNLGAVRYQVRSHAPAEAGAAAGDQYPLPAEQVGGKDRHRFPRRTTC